MIYSRWISEEYYIRARENFEIIERVKLSAQEVVQKNSGIIGRVGVDANKRRRKQSATCGNKQKVSLVWACSPIDHLKSVRKVELRFITVKYQRSRGNDALVEPEY
jgi:hypothetical protein